MPTSKVRRIGWRGRRRFGNIGPPTFFEDSETGLKPVTIEFVEWGGGNANDEALQQPILIIELQGVTKLSEKNLEGHSRIAYMKLGPLYYKFKGARRNHGERADWVIRCNPAGMREVVTGS